MPKGRHWEDIERLKLKLIERRRQLLRGLVLEAHKRIVLRTPVDTGRARGNWMLTEGEASEVVRDFLDASGQAALAEAVQFVGQMTGDDVVFIVNNLPYIGPLERGHSQQAPAGMVGVTLAEVQLIADQIIKQLRSEQSRIAQMESSANGQ